MSEANMKPILASCRCGWEGEDRQLIRVNKHDRHRYCPACGREMFKPSSDTAKTEAVS